MSSHPLLIHVGISSSFDRKSWNKRILVKYNGLTILNFTTILYNDMHSFKNDNISLV